MLLGMMMLFDKGLLAMGNVCCKAAPICSCALLLPMLCTQILFLSGVMMIIGVKKTFRFFFQKRKIKGVPAWVVWPDSIHDRPLLRQEHRASWVGLGWCCWGGRL